MGSTLHVSTVGHATTPVGFPAHNQTLYMHPILRGLLACPNQTSRSWIEQDSCKEGATGRHLSYQGQKPLSPL